MGRCENATKARTTHGCSRNGTPEYRTWQSMKRRCLNPNDKDFRLYGGRGIKIYDKWINDFALFFSYIGKMPTRSHSLDRFPDKNGNYEPNNVRWATSIQQMQNYRGNVVITFEGKTMIMSEWARLLGVDQAAIGYHIKNGKTIEQIMSHYKRKKELGVKYLKMKASD